MISHCLRFTLVGIAALLLTVACQEQEPTPSDDLEQNSPGPSPNTILIFPSGDVLPANHLKFYIEFPEPMARGDIFEHFSLINSDTGKRVPEPFREVELWDESGRRLTLWFHPGRQKPGVNLNVEIGPILEEGKNYTLTVSADWEMESGQPLGNDIQKTFRAGPMDNTQPNPDNWKYSIPNSGTTDPLTITFPSPLDYALIPRTIQIQSQFNPAINSHHNDLSIHFTPTSSWKSGAVIISINPKLEDLAGNSIARPFNLDLQAPPSLPKPSTITKGFQIK
ncbi:MAG: Ig-like domain-containing protein [Verrucomicrobia bacterium]|nr:Ig-like domain-containing protein [Verrucomicrobiota bacterium]